MNADPHDLQRFLIAQERDYATALAELRAGRKKTHWIWYILPQLAGLGTSRMASYYGIRSAEEAAAYLTHPTLGARLVECVVAINSHRHSTAEAILGNVDAMKFRSCATLFASVAGADSIFQDALLRFFDGHADDRTLALLAAESPRQRAGDV